MRLPLLGKGLPENRQSVLLGARTHRKVDPLPLPVEVEGEDRLIQ